MHVASLSFTAIVETITGCVNHVVGKRMTGIYWWVKRLISITHAAGNVTLVG